MNYAKIHDDIVKWIKESWFALAGKKVVIGISGGKDSTVCAALLAEALGPENVIGVMMPNGEQKDIADSHQVIEMLGIKGIKINIGDSYEALTKQFEELGAADKPLYSTNTPARLRMATLYGVAACVDGVVCNTCNLSEDWVGYSTKWEDAVGDFSLLNKLTKTEVVALGDYMKLPKEFVHKAPSDGMCGKTDEDNLGFTYDQLDAYIRSQPRYNIFNEYNSRPDIPQEVINKIEKMHANPNTKKKCIELDSPLIFATAF